MGIYSDLIIEVILIDAFQNEDVISFNPCASREYNGLTIRALTIVAIDKAFENTVLNIENLAVIKTINYYYNEE